MEESFWSAIGANYKFRLISRAKLLQAPLSASKVGEGGGLPVIASF